MLIDAASNMLLAAATVAPGAVVAPGWLLPSAAALVTAVPALAIPLLKGAKEQQEDWRLKAPTQAESLAALRPDAICVLEAGAKGRGLFASCPIPKGEYLFDYTGDVLTHAQYEARYPHCNPYEKGECGDYCAALKDPASGAMTFVDARDEVLGHPGRWLNHCDERPNVGRRSFFPPGGGTPRILMYSLRDVEVGEELQWNYGNGFWDAHGGKVNDE